MINIHEIRFEETNQFSKDFNYVGRLWDKYMDNSLTEEEQILWGERYSQAKLCLEQGYPIGYYESI